MIVHTFPGNLVCLPGLTNKAFMKRDILINFTTVEECIFRM